MYITLVSIFLIFYSFSSESKSLSISGNNKLSLDDIQLLTNIDITKNNLTNDDFNTIIQDLIKSDLIFDIKTNTNSQNYILDIEESSIVQNIFIINNEWIDDNLIIENLLSKKGSLLSRNKISNDIKFISNIYRTKGFKNISVISKIEKYSPDRVNLIFEINEGEQTKINLINFIGNKSFSDRFLSSKITSQSLKFYNIFKTGSNLNRGIFNSDKNKIINFYKDNGFFDVKVNYSLEPNNLNLVTLNFYIQEGKNYKINEIIYNSKIEDLEKFRNLKNKFEKKLKKNKSYYNKSLIAEFLLEINDYLVSKNINNYFIDVIINKNQNHVDLEFKDIAQRPSIVGKIDINGNAITKDKTLRSKILVEPGDYYNEYLINNSISNLKRFSYVNDITYKTDIDEDNTNLFFDLEENLKTGNFLFAGTYNTDTNFGLMFGIEDKNFSGTGNTVDANFVINSENLKYDLNLTQYPLNNPFITNTYSLFNKDNDYTNSFGFKSSTQGISYGLNFSQNKNSIYGIGISYENTVGSDAKDSSITAITENIGTFQNVNLSLSYSLDSTNDIFFPTNGHYNKLTYIISPNHLSDDAFYKLIYNNKNYFKLKNSENFIFINNNLAYAESLKDNLLTINSFSLGGNNFKGFDFRGIGPTTNNIYLGGSKLLTNTIGYGSSFIFDDKDNIYFKLFLTSGSLWDSDYSQNDDFEFRTSAGISLDLITPVGPISFTYANPISKNTLDKERVFSFSIGTSF